MGRSSGSSPASYSPIPAEVAMLFLFYEVFGIVTNLVGGWLAAKLGLKTTLFAGLGIQIVALSMLLATPAWITVPYVMVAQGLSGIAKDLTKMSSKSAVKLLVSDGSQSSLFKYVAVLTGSKNALKGIGFFVGGLLLYLFAFRTSVAILAALVAIALMATAVLMRGDLGTSNRKAKFQQIFSNNGAVNLLAAARLFLFASRDVWLVGLPVFLRSVVGWNFWQVGGFMAVWTIGYGVVQAASPVILRSLYRGSGSVPDGTTAAWLAFLLAGFPAAIALGLSGGLPAAWIIVVGLIAFGVVFALNSAVHSYLILAYTDNDKVAMDVGFYYMANACGRLAGTVLSGVLYQNFGLIGCLWASSVAVIVAGLISRFLPTALSSNVSLATVSGDD